MRVDFYLLNQSHPQAGWLFACRLIEKAYQRGHRVFVYCETADDAILLDELLWTYKDDSFIPHTLQGEGSPSPVIQISYGDNADNFNDILINMSTSIPAFHIRFQRIMEIVLDTELAKEISRQHYRTYRNQQCELHTHAIFIDNMD